MKTVLTTQHEINSKPELNEALVFTKKKYSPGAHLSRKFTKITELKLINYISSVIMLMHQM